MCVCRAKHNKKRHFGFSIRIANIYFHFLGLLTPVLAAYVCRFIYMNHQWEVFFLYSHGGAVSS